MSWGIFGDGTMLLETNPIWHLRRYLTPKRSVLRGSVMLRDEYKAPSIIKAWNIFRKDGIEAKATRQRILWRGTQGEKYPVLA